MIKTLTSVLATLLFSFLLNAQQEACIDCSLIDPNAACNLIYDPVCGCDGVTYSNDCVAQTSAGIVIYTSGECPPNGVYMCTDLAGVDLGPCDLVLGYAMMNGECMTISGCSTVGEDEVDYAGAIFPDPESCLESCQCGVASGLEESLIANSSIRYNAITQNIQVISSSQESFSLVIIDMTGRIIEEELAQNEELVDVSSLKQGSYIVTLTLDGIIIRSEQFFKTH